MVHHLNVYEEEILYLERGVDPDGDCRRDTVLAATVSGHVEAIWWRRRIYLVP